MLRISFGRAAGPGAPPLYEQLYRAVAAQIRAGELAAGERMPGKRSLAGELGLSVNTVDTAYQLLAAEGWLEARPRSGFFVLPYERPLAAAQPPGVIQLKLRLKRRADKIRLHVCAEPDGRGKQIRAVRAPGEPEGTARISGKEVVQIHIYPQYRQKRSPPPIHSCSAHRPRQRPPTLPDARGKPLVRFV